MKSFFFVATLAATLITSSLAKEVSPFASFKGNFSKRSEVEISGGNGIMASGRIAPRFSIGKSGRGARLKIQGTIKVNGAIRPLTVIYVFQPPTKDGIFRAAVSNLAPGIDDGYSAEEGSYTRTPRRIRAEIPFVFGTTKGTATLALSVKVRSRSTKLTVIYTLSSNTLESPLTWKFRGQQHR